MTSDLFDALPGSVFHEQPPKTIGANTGCQYDWLAVNEVQVISVTIKNETRPTADPRDAFFVTGPSPGVGGVAHGVKYASRFNDAHWRLAPPIKLRRGEYLSLLTHGENNDVIGAQIETSEAMNFRRRLLS